MAEQALILAAHGSRDGSAANELVRRQCRQLAARGLFDEVLCAFNYGTPSFSEVLDQCRAVQATVVPFMTSAGHFSQVFLPRELARSQRYGQMTVRQTAAVGSHPLIAELVGRRVRELVRSQRLDPARTELVLVGHGSQRHSNSRRATEDLVAALSRQLDLGGLAAAFLEEQPGLADIHRGLRHEHLIVVPFLIGGGDHVDADIPAQLGLRAPVGERLPIRQWRGERLILYDAAVGSYPEITEVVAALACDGADTAAESAQGLPAAASAGRVEPES